MAFVGFFLGRRGVVKLVDVTELQWRVGGLHVNNLVWTWGNGAQPRTSITRYWQQAFQAVGSSIGQFIPIAGQDHSAKSKLRDECPSFQSIYWQL